MRFISKSGIQPNEQMEIRERFFYFRYRSGKIARVYVCGGETGSGDCGRERQKGDFIVATVVHMNVPCMNAANLQRTRRLCFHEIKSNQTTMQRLQKGHVANSLCLSKMQCFSHNLRRKFAVHQTNTHPPPPPPLAKEYLNSKLKSKSNSNFRFKEETSCSKLRVYVIAAGEIVHTNWKMKINSRSEMTKRNECTNNTHILEYCVRFILSAKCIFYLLFFFSVFLFSIWFGSCARRAHTFSPKATRKLLNCSQGKRTHVRQTLVRAHTAHALNIGFKVEL